MAGKSVVATTCDGIVADRSCGAYCVRVIASVRNAGKIGVVAVVVNRGRRAWVPFAWTGRNGPAMASALANALGMAGSLCPVVEAGAIDSCWDKIST